MNSRWWARKWAPFHSNSLRTCSWIIISRIPAPACTVKMTIRTTSWAWCSSSNSSSINNSHQASNTLSNRCQICQILIRRSISVTASSSRPLIWTTISSMGCPRHLNKAFTVACSRRMDHLWTRAKWINSRPLNSIQGTFSNSSRTSTRREISKINPYIQLMLTIAISRWSCLSSLSIRSMSRPGLFLQSVSAGTPCGTTSHQVVRDSSSSSCRRQVVIRIWTSTWANSHSSLIEMRTAW